MGQDPEQIRDEIEETRARMGETVDAIGAKTDVKGRAVGYVSEKKDAVVEKVSGTMPDREGVKQGAGRMKGMAEQNPLGLAIGGVAVGFLAGLLLPATAVEDQRIGSVADDLKDRVRETSQEAVERGKHVAQEAGRAAAETAKQEGRSEGEELSSTLKESAQEMRSSSGSGSSSQS